MSMKHRICRILALILALCTLLSVFAFAAETPPDAQEDTPEASEAPEAPENPEAPEEPEAPEDPEASEEPEASAGEDVPEGYDFPDNWSRNALIFAVKNDILHGDQNQMLHPENYITRAEMAAVLVRMLAATGKAELSCFTDVDPTQWYCTELSAAVAAGIFNGISESKMEPNSPLTREQAVVVLSRAFGIADTDATYCTVFTDAQSISPYARAAISAMAKQGLLAGYSDGTMGPKNKITRAEIAQLIYNLFDCIVDAPEDIPASGRVLYRGAQPLPDPFALDGSIVLAHPYAGALTPADWSVTGSLSIRCGAEVSADFTAAKAGQLIFAPSKGTISGDYDTLFIGGEVAYTGSAKNLIAVNGSCTLNGTCEALSVRDGARLTVNGTVSGDIAAEDRVVLVLNGSARSITAGKAADLTVTGDVGQITLGSYAKLYLNATAALSIADGCAVTLEKDMNRLDINASDVHLTLNCRVNQLSAAGRRIVIDGTGSIGELSHLRDVSCTVPCDKKTYLSSREYELDYKEALSTVKTLKIPCLALRNAPMYEDIGCSKYVCTIPKGEIVYNENTKGSVMRVITKDGRTGYVYLGYFSIQEKNMEFDGEANYSVGTKEGFVNQKQYDSETGYLIWVSRYTQKVIIFTGSKGKWTVLKTCPCATGAAYTPTPQGVYKIFAKQDMWNFGTYIVTNVSLFFGGMAFHSYLLFHNGADFNSELGRPMSHGCVRMIPADARLIFREVPENTTVVVY